MTGGECIRSDGDVVEGGSDGTHGSGVSGACLVLG